jgi:hypothetical protein
MTLMSQVCHCHSNGNILDESWPIILPLQVEERHLAPVREDMEYSPVRHLAAAVSRAIARISTC